MNKVVLYGRLSREPELKYSQNGVANVFITIAVDRGMSREKRQEAEAQGKPTADFIACKAFNRTAELIGDYFHSGSRILAEGRIQTGSYEKDGQRIYTTDIILDRIHFIDTRSEVPEGDTVKAGHPAARGFGPAGGQAGYYPINPGEVPF